MIPFGARHSMGKQSIQENAIHIDLKNLRAMKLEDGLLRVEAGARWSQVLNFLAPRGLAVEVRRSLLHCSLFWFEMLGDIITK